MISWRTSQGMAVALGKNRNAAGGLVRPAPREPMENAAAALRSSPIFAILARNAPCCDVFRGL